MYRYCVGVRRLSAAWAILALLLGSAPTMAAAVAAAGGVWTFTAAV
jgi:hypothetical protein